ncbi:diacylglycerol O-acyltransferase [Spizellomyces sp. 'palustris']|nr:diacylglycerol O-acyltransferase [Spizellomyces sp. 'palustris']
MPVKVAPEASANDADNASLTQQQETEVAVSDRIEYLTGRDNLFLIMEDKYHNMNVAGLYYFNKKVSREEMRTQIGHFADTFDRCKQRIVRPPGVFARPYWVKHDEYDLDKHFLSVQLPSPGTEEQLMQVSGELCGEHMEFGLPLWRCYWFEGLDGGERSAILWIAHHAIADGQGFVRTFLTYVASLDPTIDASKLQYSAGRNIAKPKTVGKVIESEKKPATILSHIPSQKSAFKYVQRQVFTFMFLLYGMALYLANILIFLASRRKSYTRSKKTNKKQTAWNHSVSLEDVKKIKNHFKVTVNDVLTACVGAALDGHLIRNNAPRDSNLWLMIPTSMRAVTDFSTSNKTSGYMLSIPNGPNVDLVKRVKAVSKNMRSGKSSPEAAFHYFPQEIFYRYPNALPSFALGAAYKLHGVLTNVPGPAVPLKWGTHNIDAMVAFIPQAMPNSVSCAVYTYQGHVTLSVNMDLDEEPGLFGPGAALSITKEFEAAFQEYVKIVDASDAVKVKKDL